MRAAACGWMKTPLDTCSEHAYDAEYRLVPPGDMPPPGRQCGLKPKYCYREYT